MRSNTSVFNDNIRFNQDAQGTYRYNRILEGINRIFSAFLQAKTEEEVGNTCLSVALEITGSQIGFVGEIGSDELLHDMAVSDVGWSQCTIHDRTSHTGHRSPKGDIVLNGLYGHVIKTGKSLLTNDPSAHPEIIGFPHGHPQLTSFLGVPLVGQEKCIGLLAVANRKGGYNYEQLEDLEALAPALTLALSRIKEERGYRLVEAALKKEHDNLKVKINERTAELENAYSSLKESEKSLAKAQRLAHLGSWEFNILTDKVYWSEEMYRIFGHNPQAGITYDKFLSCVHPEDRDNLYKSAKDAIDGKIYATDYRIIRPDGEVRIIHSEREVFFDEKNNPVKIRGTVQDITEHIKSEERIQYLANIVESSNDAIGTISPDGFITSWNKGAEHVYCYSATEILGKPVSILAPSHLIDETIKLSDLVKRGEKIRNYETIRVRKDEKIIYVSFTLSPVFDINGNLIAVSFISRDITKRKEAENALENIEIARKKEIHHRIKNNLQVISSLLDLQAEKFYNKKYIKDSEVLEAFGESQNRVISMALIHEELHKGGEIDTLNFSQYVGKLAENLFLTYRLGNENISLNADIEEDIFFDMDTSVPLGIIINELVSNSLKHAFTGRDKGKIQIKLHRKENEECKSEDCKSTAYVLSISDNGIGIPDDIDIGDSDTLGMQLVTSLVDQLDGELELKRDNGTEFIIRLTVTKKNYKELESPTIL